MLCTDGQSDGLPIKEKLPPAPSLSVQKSVAILFEALLPMLASTAWIQDSEASIKISSTFMLTSPDNIRVDPVLI